MPRAQLIQLRRGTAAEWTTANSILASGEGGLETDTNQIKYGDGSTAWNSLDYVSVGEGGGASDWDDITGTPTTLAGYGITDAAAITHAHVISDTTGLQAALDAKATTASVASVASDVASIQSDLSSAVGEGELVRESAAAAASETAIVVTADPYNALGDGREILDGAMTSGQATLTSATASFTAEDVGKIILVDGAGANTGFGVISSVAARKPLVTTISARTNSTTVTLATTALATVSSARCIFGSDDTAALQSAFTAASHVAGASITFPQQRIFFITSSLQIVRYAAEDDQIPGGGKYANIKISGYGALIVSGTADIDFISITSSVMYFSPVIEGLSFEGIAGVDQTGINLSATYGMALRDLKMRRVGIGIELNFALMGRVDNVMVDYYTKYALYMHTTSNATVVDGMRARANSLGLCSFALVNTDQCELRNCISEQPPEWTGSSFVCDVLFEQTTSMGDYGHGLIVSNFYSESPGATTAIFKIINDGYTVIEKFTRQFDLDVPLIDATGSTTSTITCRDWSLSNAPIAAGNSWIRFKQNAGNTVGWLFENMGEIARGETTNLVTNDALWIGGVIPTKITQIEPGRIASAP